MRRTHTPLALPVLSVILLLGASRLALSQKSAPPERPSGIPAAVEVPAGLPLILIAHASGWQIYSCQAAADGKFSWTLKAPEADLRDDDGKIIRHHFAGPVGS